MHRQPTLPALLRAIMKITVCQFLLAILFVSIAVAREGRAQEVLGRRITLTAVGQPARSVLSRLEQQADIRFMYSAEVIQADRAVSISVQEQRLDNVLNQLLSPLRITYRVVGQQIVLNLDEASAKSELQMPAAAPTISGKVTAKNGEALPGVNVTIKGKTRGASTDAQGQFKLEADAGETLVFSFIGYKNQEVALTGQTTVDVVLEESSATLQEVAVVGSRSNVARTDVERPVPVDVLTAKELQSTGQTELSQQVQFTSPSFNSAKNGINGVASYADPSSLKGLSPDQMLVLVDGKRRHQFGAVNLNVTVGKGTVVTDMNAVPSLAVERLEILRDGAAAQYGSDAIAGIVNLNLKKSVGVGSALVQYGVTSQGDGGGYTVGVNYGFRLAKTGYLNVTGSYQDAAGTDRSDPYNPQPVAGGAYTGAYTTNRTTDESTREARGVYGQYGTFKVTQYGSSALKSGQLFYNAGIPLTNNWSLYSFGGYSRKRVNALGFFRTAIPTVGTTNPSIYPDGFTPQLPGSVQDYSVVVGIRKKVLTGWNFDFSTGYGYNYLDQNVTNSTNASLGAASPKDFYVGRITFGQSVSEANLNKTMFGVAGTKTLSLALGAQYRVDRFQLMAGDPASFQVGPLAATNNKIPGSQGRVGISTDDETNRTRSNVGIYADVESDLTDKLLVAAALRYENYSDFGSNLSGKLATRLKLNDNFSIRGSINRGFRAPLLQQVANAVTTSTVQNGVVTSTKEIPNSDPRLAQIGIEDPKAETSWNYNIGLTAKAARNKLLFTLDAYQIDIRDRIIITENLRVANIAALKPLFPNLQEITFFTNQVNTQTRGVDFVTSFRQTLRRSNVFTASVALTVNKTSIVGTKGTPAQLQAGTATPILLIDTVSRALIETSQPHTKVMVSLGYQVGKLTVTLRSSYFGAVTAWEKPSGLPHRAQTFGGKNLFDLSAVYALNKMFSLTLGGNNITNVYPDRVFTNYASYSNGQVPFTRNANQFGFNGSYYYANLMINF
ncbi:TonB-dependent receptor [Spirosoma rhododendri]|uniref:TonB-dependent receptor n=1 Tax=Spirosoma rhododendri TaxID=2728024 RepID=A0A7L5DTD3_9BACT|nr:TonB-dependent receptor [Spirosoma rhododendri]QJD80701.1 TonB-dependent receptor [Spirosoma rhododendri]